jgi:hypothetical protein
MIDAGQGEHRWLIARIRQYSLLAESYISPDTGVQPGALESMRYGVMLAW